ncbi:MAG: phosphatase PAP2 family protein, partial [Anaerovoracaceae bacterium]
DNAFCTMKRETYEKMMNTVESSEVMLNSVLMVNKALTRLSYIIYPIFLLFIAVKKEPELIKAVLVPAISFIIVSIFRYLCCSPRPYEVFDIPPLIKKDTRGKSFPSRHVFSAVIIAVTVYYYYPLPGIILGILSLMLAAVRVIGGVHFTKDVVAGIFMGVCFGIIGFYVI